MEIKKIWLYKRKEMIKMYAELHLHNADLKYWIEEFPILSDVEVQLESIKINREDIDKKDYLYRKLALEVYLYRNAGNYALLGMEYMPNDGNELIVNVNYITENQIHYQSELTKYNDYKYVGLLEEYKEIIIDTIKSSHDIGGGILNIPVAVNCEVGSCPIIFGKVMKMLLEVLCGDKDDINLDLKIQKLYKKIF